MIITGAHHILLMAPLHTAKISYCHMGHGEDKV